MIRIPYHLEAITERVPRLAAYANIDLSLSDGVVTWRNNDGEVIRQAALVKPVTSDEVRQDPLADFVEEGFYRYLSTRLPLVSPTPLGLHSNPWNTLVFRWKGREMICQALLYEWQLAVNLEAWDGEVRLELFRMFNRLPALDEIVGVLHEADHNLSRHAAFRDYLTSKDIAFRNVEDGSIVVPPFNLVVSQGEVLYRAEQNSADTSTGIQLLGHIEAFRQACKSSLEQLQPPPLPDCGIDYELDLV